MTVIDHDVIVVGGGIVGLATALRIIEKHPGLNVVVIEKEAEVALHQTGHNSGVIHSGLYYKPGSLKARLCREGYAQLVDFCKREEIAHEICGKVVVATSEKEIPQLEALYNRGLQNGLRGIKRLDAQGIRSHEPHVRGVGGLFIPETGIVDYKQVCDRYRELAQRAGVEFVFNTSVSGIIEKSVAAEVIAGQESWTAKAVITCAGLQSDKVARLSNSELDLRILPFRGEYFKLTDEAQSLVRNLVYPVPNPDFPFLGVHFTRMIGGGIECGPNAVLAFAREGYRKTDFSFSDTLETLTWPGFRRVAYKYWKTGIGEYYRSMSKGAFTRALQQLIPEVRADDLVVAPAGVRAQACDRDGGLLDDFAIRRSNRVINVCNAPSPAATASLAIGESIAGQALELLV
jgi:L-2-hydroxyglutarate oxidase